MRYASIREMDISNGEGIGVSLFVQGCPFMCNGCFNPETWDFSGGKEYTHETYDTIMELLNRPYIKRFSILGGEPLAFQNVKAVAALIADVKLKYPDKKIWLYTGYTFEEIMDSNLSKSDDLCRIGAVTSADILVDGRYVHEKRDMNLKWRGSSNQRVIDVNKTCKNIRQGSNKIELYCD